MKIILHCAKITNDIPYEYLHVKCNNNTPVECKWQIVKSNYHTISCKSYIPDSDIEYRDKNGFRLACILELTRMPNNTNTHQIIKTLFGDNCKKKSRTCVYELYPNTVIIE